MSESAEYRCKHCGKVVERDSTKAWIESMCDATGKTVHLTRVTRADEGD